MTSVYASPHEKIGNLQVFHDPIDPKQTNNSYQALVGLSDKLMRTDFLKMSNKHVHFYDLYRNLDVLLPLIFKIPCYFIFLDYPTYQKIKEQIIAHLTSSDTKSPTPIAVYWAESIFNHPCLFDVDKAHDEMMACFWSCHKEAESSFLHGDLEHISVPGSS